MNWIITAAIYGALGVAFGAFGAHGLKAKVTPELLETWSVASHYHLLHSVVLLALALFGVATAMSIRLPSALFAAGIGLFSGSLYLLVLFPSVRVGIVTPLGGLLLIAGWLSLIRMALSSS